MLAATGTTYLCHVNRGRRGGRRRGHHHGGLVLWSSHHHDGDAGLGGLLRHRNHGYGPVKSANGEYQETIITVYEFSLVHQVTYIQLVNHPNTFFIS